MFRGKEKCKILKQIRQTIASENDIPLVVEECHYKGECRGTCPRCESELEYLEKELLKRRAMGKKLVLAGLSAGLSWTPIAAAENIQVSEVSTQQDTTQNDGRTILIKGTVVDSEGKPICGAAVLIQGTTKGVATDFDGNFSLKVRRNDVLRVSSIGYYDEVIKKIKSSYLWIALTEVSDDLEIAVSGTGMLRPRETPIDSLFWEYDQEYDYYDYWKKYIRYDGRPTPKALISDGENKYRSSEWFRNLEKDIQYHKVYPKVEEIKENVEVKVRFVVNADQSLSDFKIVSSNDERFNDAAIETIKRMNDRWLCRRVNGKPVKTRRSVKIVYWIGEIYRSEDGTRNLEQDIQYHKVYPRVEEIKEDVKVEVWFVINADQSISFRTVSSNDKRFDEAAIETIKRMDGWQCRKVNGKPIATRKMVKFVYRKEELQMLSKQKDGK